MLIHKAWYGPKGGHSLLSSTEPALHQVFRQVAWLTDLPGTLPAGLEWEPYFRAGIRDGYYVLVHTRSSKDTSRAGMVDSVAAFIRLDELHLVPNIRELADDLAASHEGEDRTPFEPASPAPDSTATAQNPLLAELAQALISAKQRTIVYIGQAGFDDAMLDLLQVVPVTMRKEVLFSLTFSHADLGDSIAVAVPQALASRYPQGRLLTTPSEPLSIGAAALLNRPEGRPLLAFGEAAHFDLQSASSLLALEQTFRLWEGTAEVTDAIKLVRLLAAKSGNAATANEVRLEALRRLTSMSGQWTPVDVLAMRNLALHRFDAGELHTSVQAWVRKRAEQTASNDDCQLLIQAARRAATQEWWNTEVRAGYMAAISSGASGMSTLAWQVLVAEPEASECVLVLFEDAGKLPSLATRVPTQLTSKVADAVAQAAAKLASWQLCGVALASAYAPSKALLAVAKLEPAKNQRRVAFEASLSKASPSELVAIAVREDSPELTVLAAEKVADTPDLIRVFDWNAPVWFDILDKVSLKSRLAAVEVPRRLESLRELIHRGEQSYRVWAPLVKVGLADLTLIENRPSAWSLIPGSLLQAVLDQTVKGWFAGATEGTVGVGELEEPLRGEVRAFLRDHQGMVSLSQKSPSMFINVMNEVYPQTERDCVALISSLANSYGFRLAATPAVALGKLIRDRHWSAAATEAAKYGKSRDEFLPVCRECESLMTFWDRWLLGSRLGKPTQISPDEAWRMFEQTLADLYPHGPTENELWSRSGGNDNQLNTEGNGMAQWHRCIKLVRAGKDPKPADLLRHALREFHDNRVLLVLRDSRALE